MSERLFVDACVVNLPLKLSPVEIAQNIGSCTPQAIGKFLTSVSVRYQPNVSTATSGLVALGLSTSAESTLKTIAANEPNHIGPVWKPATLVLPKERLNLQEWSTQDSPCLYLVGDNLQGHVTITCTLRVTLSTTWPLPRPPPDPAQEAANLNTQAYVGPVIEGFSLVCCAPDTLQPEWNGQGQVINIDLTEASGTTTSAGYGLKTPANKPYVAVRYGFGSKFSYRYNSKNTLYQWQNNSGVIYEYGTSSAATSAVPINYFASWRPINGSTSWWCDITPTRTEFVLNGHAWTWYYPMCQLVVYYYYPDVDIFDDDFRPGFKANPLSVLPSPPGEAEPNKPQYIPLNMGRNQQMWSRWWRPDFCDAETGADLLKRFNDAQLALTSWPTTASPGSKQVPVSEHSHSDGDKTLGRTEEAWQNVDA